MSFAHRTGSLVRSKATPSTARRLRAACTATWETLEDRVLLTAVVAPEPATVPTTFPAPGESFFVQGLTSAQNNGQASFQNASAITPVTTNDLILNQLPDALTSGTATGGTANSITLGSSASSTTDAYKGYYIDITGGTGAGQNALITAYDGTTKVATIARGASNAATFTSPWTTIPDATSTYAVRNTNYQGTFEGAGGSIALLTNGTTGNPTNPTTNDKTANTNSLFDRDNRWQATYTLGNNPNGYDITEIDSITGHSDPRVNQTIDVQVQYVGSDTNFYSLSAGKNFSYRPDNLNPAPGGSAQLSIIDSSGAGNAIAHNVKAIRYVDVDSGAVVRELSVIGAPSASAPTAPTSAPALTGNVTNGADLNLTWTDSDANVSGYKIFKSTDGTNFTPLTLVPGSATSYTDLAAQPNTSYSYYIVATNNGADSPRSATLTLKSAAFGAEAHFYNATFWQGTPVVSETLNTIDQNHNDGSAPAPGVNTTNYSAIFTGKVRTDAAGNYTFISNSDDDGFLYVNGQLVSEDPGGHGQRDASILTPISLAANTQYDFVFLMNQGGGGSGFHLLWKAPVVDSSGNQTGSAAEAIVPADHLSPVSDVPPAPQGLTASYYNNQVNLSWFTVNDTSSISYLIERAAADANGNATGNFAPLATVSAEPITNNTPSGTVGGFLNYGDASAVPGQNYVYRITAVNFDGTALDPTTASVQIPANTQTPGAEAHYFNDEYWKGGGDPRISGTPDTNAVSYSGIDSDWGNASPDPTIRADQFSTQYTGQILTDQAGVYTFVTNTDDEGFLFLNDGTSNTYKLVSSDPGGHGQRDATNVVGVSLAAHTAYNFIFEQSENGGGAGAHLKWIKPADNTGVAQAGSTANTIVLANSASDQDNSYVGDYVIINSGTGAGQAAQIISYAGATRTATVTFDNGATAWGTAPAADSGYVVAPFGVIPAAGSGTVGDPSTTGGLLQVMDAPAAPTGLTVAGAGLDRVTLNWTDNAKSEIHYVIERATDSNFTQNDKVVGTTGFDATSFTDTGLTAGAKYYYRVRAANYDFQSAFSNTASATTLASAATGGSLAGLESAPAADTNLTMVGTQDWTHYGWFGPSVERMAGTPVIGNLITTGTPVGYGGNPNTYSWTNGFPVSPVVATGSGDFIAGVGNGFELTAPADTTTRTLRVYVGEFNSTGKFTAHLSDGSAPDFVDQSLVNTGGTLTGVYTITYHASAPGEQLVVDWKMASDNGGGNVTLQAAALSGTELIAPAGFSARTCAPGEVELNWTPNSVGETGFGIEQSADGVNFTQIAVAPAGSHTYTLTGLPQNTTYTYRIRALGTTNSGYSNTSATNATGPLGVSHTSGFTGQSDLQLNGNAAVTATGALELTNGKGNQDSSAFTKLVQRVDNFDTTFDFQLPVSDADGFTFAIQNINPNVLGGGGGAMGYGGVGRQSVALKFDLYNGGPTANTTGLYINGNNPDDTAPASIDMSPAGINLHSGDKFQVHLTYDGTTLHEVVTDTTTNASFSHDYTVDIPSIVGDHCAYVGFTGASGGSASQIDIGDWTYTANTTSTGPTTSQTVVGTGGNDTITVKKDADGTHDDIWVNVPATGAPTQQAVVGQPIVINGGGGTDTLVLDSSNGNPMPSLLTLNAGTGSFALSGVLPALDASHIVDLGKSTLSIPYTGTSPLPSIQGALKSGFIKSTDAAGSSGKFAIADVDNGSQVSLSYRVVGDLNGDGTVAFADLLTMAQNYNKTGKDWSTGDLTYDGTVNFNDLLALAQHYNQSASSTAAVASPNLATLSSVVSAVQTSSTSSTKKKASKVTVASKRP